MQIDYISIIVSGGMSLLIITMLIRQGNRLTSIESKDEAQKFLYKEFKKDIEEIKKTFSEVNYKGQKSLDASIRAHERIDCMERTIEKMSELIQKQQLTQLKLQLLIEGIQGNNDNET